MASVWTIRLHAPLFQGKLSGNVFELRKDLFGISTYTSCPRWVSSKDVNHNLMFRAFRVSASTSDPIQDDIFPSSSPKIPANQIQDDVLPSSSPKIPANPIQDDVLPSSAKIKSLLPLQKFQEIVISLPHRVIHMKRHTAASFSIGLIAAATLLIVFLKSYVAKKSKPSQPGSVADLVRRGQLRSDRRGISTPLKYEDPFNNPLVKAGKSNSTVEMCGKVYRLAPVTLTKEQQAIHQKRRSRAYQWKRPELFLKEGDSIPADVDPDTVRWIPANHPFATTASDIDEDLAQENVYQKSGVPFRIRAEHEALQRKLEALQKGQKLGKLVLDPGAVKDFERPYKLPLKPEDQEQNASNSQQCSKPPNSEFSHGSFVNRAPSEEIEKS